MDIHRNINLKSKCLHQKNIYSLIDLSPADPQYTFITNHLKSCSNCSKEKIKFELEVQAMQVFIPKPVMDKELKESFNRELHEMLINLGMNKFTNKKQAVTSVFNTANTTAELFIKNLFSKTVLISMGFGGIIFLILRSRL
jgi:hypothetical protein